jgi:UDP-galactose transporter B1
MGSDTDEDSKVSSQGSNQDAQKPYLRNGKTVKKFGKFSDSDTSEDEQSKMSAIDRIKDWYYLSLLVCFVGIIGCYSGYAYLQESLLSDKEKKLNTNFVIGVQSLLAVLISSSIIKSCNMGNLLTDLSQGDVTVGVLNFATMYCSNFALKFVNYPFMVLAKSAKILPVILTGWLTGVYKLSMGQVGIAITISAGLVIFNFAKVRKGSLVDDSALGVFLVLLSLLFDGFVNS